jgi:DNA-binding transcriptional ArsR family regulator
VHIEITMDFNTFSALAEPNRFQIVELLLKGPRPVNEISHLLKFDQPKTSKHLKVLANTGVVEAKPMAQKRVYSLSPKPFKEMYAWIESYRQIWENNFDRLDKVLEGMK